MIVAITGHRPNKIKELNGDVVRALRRKMRDLDASYVIQGQAAGIDLLAARAAYGQDIPFTCAIPWRGHKPMAGWEKDYERAIEEANEVYYVNESEKYPGPYVYFQRNHWMVDNADIVLAYWDGVVGKGGGTFECVTYALSKGKEVVNIYGEVVPK